MSARFHVMIFNDLAPVLKGMSPGTAQNSVIVIS